MKKLGIWSSRLHEHDQIAPRRPFHANLGHLNSDQLADEMAYWTSELGRISEITGVISSQKVYADLRVRQALATARHNVRSNKAYATDTDGKPKKLTQSEVNDLAERDPNLVTVRENEALVDSYLATLQPMKDVTIAYLQTLSREITRRGDLQRARL